MRPIVWMITLWICLLSAATGKADDTDILDATATKIAPNVLIIFDTSSSMRTRDIPATPYDRRLDYAAEGGQYAQNVVYRWTNGPGESGWTPLAEVDSLGESCNSSGRVDALISNGQVWARIHTTSPYTCGEDDEEIDLRMGNFLNYEAETGSVPTRSRIEVAKEVVKQLIDDHPHVRFGLMRFAGRGTGLTNDTAGGRLSEHGDINSHATANQLKADIDAFTAESYTPLAETLAEAGLYFSGSESWFNGVTYTTPIDIKCRPNYIILMTDGDSTKDQDPRLALENAYIHNGTFGDYDQDGNESRRFENGGSDFLDDVAAFLFENDLMPNMGSGDPLYEKQNVVTYTIGFKHTHSLLRDTAENGGGEYFTAGSRSALQRAFDKILGHIEGGRQGYAAPSIPASRANSVYAGDSIYMALFSPDHESGQWSGNLKKYTLDSSGRLLDANNLPATDSDGMVLETARSFWSAQVDGTKVKLGGAGALLVNRASRTLYTFTGGAETNLTADINAFSISNRDNIPLSVLDVANDEERQAIINDVHGVGKLWVMADVLHSEPVAVSYDTNGNGRMDADDDALIFVGTNGGVMHAIRDSDGQEVWGFIPPQQLGRLKLLSDYVHTHDYFLDGPPAAIAFDDGAERRKTLVFGERRGGNNYYVLDVTSPDEPIWKYRIGDDYLGQEGERLGQSWGRPQKATIAAGAGTAVDTFLLPGGYDNNQDAHLPSPEDTCGRAVFSVQVSSGDPGVFHFSHGDANADMTHCIVDLVGVDLVGDGITRSVYAPDLGGHLFAFSDSDSNGVWTKLRLFDASSDGTQRKIFHSPDVIKILGDPDPNDSRVEQISGEMIFFGTGDQAHPMAAEVVNRFYAVKNFWWPPDGFTTLNDRIDAQGNGDLHDATDNLIVEGTAQERTAAANEIQNRMGWFIELAGRGEKVVSSPIVYNRTVYFTTYVPPVIYGGSEADCDGDTARSSEARLYGLDYKDGRAVHDDWKKEKTYDPETGEEIVSGGKADRYIVIGHSMPSSPIIAIRQGVAMLYIGVGGELVSIVPKQGVEMNMYYWREMVP